MQSEPTADNARAVVPHEKRDYGDLCTNPLPPEPRVPPWTKPLGLDDARQSLREVERLREAGDGATALLHLRVIESAVPRIADRIALRRGELLRELGMARQACDAYKQALDSPDRNVVVRARVGLVYCQLEAADRKGAAALQSLLWRYPHLSDREMLRYKLALARETQGNRWGAAMLLRTIDLQEPASPVATLARRELERLRGEGVAVRALSPRERLERTERLLRWAPIEQTLSEVEALRELRLTPDLRARLHILSAKIARVQGKWDEVDAEIAEARHQGVAVPDVGKVILPPLPPEDEAAKQVARRRVRQITLGRPIRRLRNAQLRRLVDLAAQYGFKDLADETVEAIGRRSTFTASARFSSAMRLAGLASDESLITLLEPVLDVPRYRLGGTYHYARALERLGRYEEAKGHYQRILEIDQTETRYYAMWSEQRLWAMQSQQQLSCMPALGAVDQALAAARSGKALRHAAFGAKDSGRRGLSSDTVRERAIGLLQPVVDAHGDAYPWLARALDLVHLALFEEAADELNETYMAWRDAKGSPRLRAGLTTIFTGQAPPRHWADFRIRRARLALSGDDESRQALERAAKLLGDPGVGLRFGDWRLGERPRAYADEVERAARKYGLDPNLLFAVMRVESIYNRRIVSYAGAVGLMQIMPATGKRIADRLGVGDFETPDLLDPRTNLEFSAWYLSSLIERFDGRLPLAIASYNGGPHNVRLWMRNNHRGMPLDAFLERIPFSQTHRYVRRVLTHYAAYRAQQNLPMTRLDLTLPDPEPDAIGF